MNSETKNSFNQISSVLDQYTEWYNDILLQLFYPAQEKVKKPQVPVFSLGTLSTNDTLEIEGIQRLQLLKGDLVKISEELLAGSSPPPFKNFETFSQVYEEFSNQLRRVEIDRFMDDNGIDVLTGLRSRNAMMSDIARELDRLARRGKPFCLALAQIDNFTKIRESYNLKECNVFIMTVAELIKKSMRSFDDAYRLSNGEFILCLKQTEMSGGLAALERMRKLLERERISVSLDGNAQPLTMSCVIAEPVEGDMQDNLVDNLRHDLASMERTEGAVLEYYEMSPLQRFVKTSQ